MTLQLDWPYVFYAMAGNYSGNWDVRAQLWWARRIMDAVSWESLGVFDQVTAAKIDRLEGAAVVHYGHRPEIEIIIPRYNAYVAALQRDFAAGFPVAYDSRRYDVDDIDAVRDWLGSLDETMLGKLWKLSWRQGLEHANRWHGSLAKAAQDKAAGDLGVCRKVPSHDGFNWCRLRTIEAFDREGSNMGHCVGKGSYDHYAAVQDETLGIWSLRDDAGHSHVTVEVGGYVQGDKPVYRLFQAKGPKNRALTPEEQVHLDVFTSALEIDTSRPSLEEWAQRQFSQMAAYLEAERVAERFGAMLEQFAHTITENLGRVAVTAGVDSQTVEADVPNGTVISFWASGGSVRDGSAMADAIFSTPKLEPGSVLSKALQPRRAAPPSIPHYRQHERRGRHFGRT